MRLLQRSRKCINGMEIARNERQHDYIQFLFPLMDPFAFQSQDSAASTYEVRKIRRDKAASLRVRKSFEMMLDFFGFQLADVSKGNSFPKSLLIHVTTHNKSQNTGTIERKSCLKDLPKGWVKRSSMLSGDEYYEHKATGHKCRFHPGSALRSSCFFEHAWKS